MRRFIVEHFALPGRRWRGRQSAGLGEVVENADQRPIERLNFARREAKEGLVIDPTVYRD